MSQTDLFLEPVKEPYVLPEPCRRKHPNRETHCVLDLDHKGRHMGGEPFPENWDDSGKISFGSFAFHDQLSKGRRWKR